MKTIACCYGTRPEFIKMASVVLELERRYPLIKPFMVCSGQHEALLDGLNKEFGIHVDRLLDIRKIIGQTDSLPLLAEATHTRFAQAFAQLKPDGVLVQGDAASSFLAALAAFHLHIPIYYVEAGLRTNDLEQPFPEEGYRQMTSRLASYCFAPTEENKKNLLREGISKNRIFVTGNTIVDALEMIVKGSTLPATPARLAAKRAGGSRQDQTLTENFPWLKTMTYRRLILVTIHRRENQGEVLRRMLRALLSIQRKYPRDLFVFSVHPNPRVRIPVYSLLKNNARFVLINPPNYVPFLALLSVASAVMTDSGGIQEEAPSFGIPTLVLRNKTERTEGVKAGWSLLAGTEEQGMISVFERLNTWKQPKTGNPYGDGKAAARIAKIISRTV